MNNMDTIAMLEHMPAADLKNQLLYLLQNDKPTKLSKRKGPVELAKEKRSKKTSKYETAYEKAVKE